MSDSAFATLAERLVSDGIAADAAVAVAFRAAGDDPSDDKWVMGRGHAGDSLAEPIFDLASLTKPMTAVAIARSCLETRALGSILEEAHGTASARATLELLLAHRAGLEAHRALDERGTAASSMTRTHGRSRAAADPATRACSGPPPRSRASAAPSSTRSRAGEGHSRAPI